MIDPLNFDKPIPLPVLGKRSFSSSLLTTDTDSSPEMSVPTGRLLGRLFLVDDLGSPSPATALGSIFPESGTEDRYAIVFNAQTIASFRVDVEKDYGEGYLQPLRNAFNFDDVNSLLPIRKSNDPNGYIFVDNIFISEDHAKRFPNLGELLIQMMVEISLNNGCNGSTRIRIDKGCNAHPMYFYYGFRNIPGRPVVISDDDCKKSLEAFSRSGAFLPIKTSEGTVYEYKRNEECDFIEISKANPILTEYDTALTNIDRKDNSGFQFPGSLTLETLLKSPAALSLMIKVVPEIAQEKLNEN